MTWELSCEWKLVIKVVLLKLMCYSNVKNRNFWNGHLDFFLKLLSGIRTSTTGAQQSINIVNFDSKLSVRDEKIKLYDVTQIFSVQNLLLLLQFWVFKKKRQRIEKIKLLRVCRNVFSSPYFDCVTFPTEETLPRSIVLDWHSLVPLFYWKHVGGVDSHSENSRD